MLLYHLDWSGISAFGLLFIARTPVAEELFITIPLSHCCYLLLRGVMDMVVR